MKKYLIICVDENAKHRFKKIIQKKMKIKRIFDYNNEGDMGFIITSNSDSAILKKLSKKHPRQIKVSKL